MGFLESFFVGTLSTIVGGVFLAIFFFWIREKCFGIADVSGTWYFDMTTQKTAYKPYENMVLRYVAVVWREGNHLYGTVEKVYEISSTGEREYIGENRSRGSLTGVYEKNYFSKDRMHIHINERGKGRESTNFFILDVNKQNFVGTFNSFVANQEGLSIWQRKPF
ncbi:MULTISPECIES: hypothetical protein [Pseudoalteromonas]|jgi:hypothetical protein|uniref:hypothetical protein n=1 Tax=Pseudoalteromonas TaxID=53246 RepID=UPI000C601B3E|nr:MULTISPECIES: hypothetical protein [Pseudoalteromonas]MAE01292.1 hypothetical protein [Pseudoalteromonas sp.]QMW15444.1 hypothetical protein H3302_04905 [Pseudoalteromonas sp. MT33b]|tara:strand:+ start:1868 stop:2362 length:495 start_codon:yes stop_codon:yes gene_type:complete